MAQINIPIEVLSNGQTRPHIRCAQIEFLPCDNLPPEHENPNQFVMEKMSAWLGGNNKKTETFTEPLPVSQEYETDDSANPTSSTPIFIPELLSLFISKEDIARTVKTRGQTITFKNYPKAIRSHNMTEKNR